jgi:hypothetical protein
MAAGHSVDELRRDCELAIASKRRGDALEFHSVVQRITSCTDHVRPRPPARAAACPAIPSQAGSHLSVPNSQAVLRQWLGALTYCASEITVRERAAQLRAVWRFCGSVRVYVMTDARCAVLCESRMTSRSSSPRCSA